MSQSVIPTFDRVAARAKILASGKSVAAIARELGYERQTVGHWLRGRGEPTMKQMHELSAKIGCHWLELVTQDAVVLNDPQEINRTERIRGLSADKRALIDSLLGSIESPERGD